MKTLLKSLMPAAAVMLIVLGGSVLLSGCERTGNGNGDGYETTPPAGTTNGDGTAPQEEEVIEGEGTRTTPGNGTMNGEGTTGGQGMTGGQGTGTGTSAQNGEPNQTGGQ